MAPDFKYRKDFDEAKQRLGDLLKQREELETTIAKQKRRVAALAQLCEDNEGIAVDVDLDLGGLTDACRTVLRASRKDWMTAGEIATALEEIGFPIRRYKAVAATLNTTLLRLVETNGVQELRITGGSKVYKWAAPNYGASNSLANQMADRERDRRKK